MDIRFPQSEPVYTSDTTITFPAVVDGSQVSCEISEEALLDHFGAASRHGTALVAAFKAHRAIIESTARQKYQGPGFRWLLKTEDF